MRRIFTFHCILDRDIFAVSFNYINLCELRRHKNIIVLFIIFFVDCKSARIFVCKQLRYAWNNQSRSFEQLQGLNVNIMNSFYYKQMALNHDEQLARRLIYGNNEITVPYKDLKTLLFLEILNPFYVFQMFSVLLWFAYDYYYYACVIIMMTVTGIIMSIRQTKKVQNTQLEDPLQINNYI